jgi:uncharacterized protein (DUF433 family)
MADVKFKVIEDYYAGLSTLDIAAKYKLDIEDVETIIDDEIISGYSDELDDVDISYGHYSEDDYY